MKAGLTRPLPLIATLGALAALGVTGCAPKETETTVVTTPPTETTTVTTGTPPGPPPGNNVNAGPGGAMGTDEATAEEIKRAIVNNKQMTGSRVEVVVTGGEATLTGFTQNQQQKALAARAAEDTPGIASVKNKLEIRPTGGAKPKPPAPPGPNTTIIVNPSQETAPPAEPTRPGSEMPPPTEPTPPGAPGMTPPPTPPGPGGP